MESLQELCKKIVCKKYKFELINSGCNWLDCGFACIPFRLYQELMANLFWYCRCKRRIFYITTETNKKYNHISDPENCFYCWFTFLIKIKVKLIYKKKDNLVHLTSALIEFFELLNKFKYIYIQPNYEKIDYFENYETFSYYLNPNLGCLCYNKSSINFL